MSAIVGYNLNTDGLVTYFDALNPRSYPGTGPTWFDLSQYKNNTSVSNVTYESSPISNFYSDGQLTSYIDFQSPNLAGTATVEVICKFITLTPYLNAIFGWDQYWVGVFNTPNIMFYTTDDGANDRMDTSITFNTGEWYYFIFEMRSDISFTNNKIWVNGTLQTLNHVNGETVSNRNFNSGLGRMSSYNNMSPFYNYTGNNNYAMFRVYNRAFTQQEVTNNYNHFKSIYNLA
jgi:hypothetical protein